MQMNRNVLSTITPSIQIITAFRFIHFKFMERMNGGEYEYKRKTKADSHANFYDNDILANNVH